MVPPSAELDATHPGGAQGGPPGLSRDIPAGPWIGSSRGRPTGSTRRFRPALRAPIFALDADFMPAVRERRSRVGVVHSLSSAREGSSGRLRSPRKGRLYVDLWATVNRWRIRMPLVDVATWPLLLCGPLLRRVEPRAVSVFVALEVSAPGQALGVPRRRGGDRGADARAVGRSGGVDPRPRQVPLREGHHGDLCGGSAAGGRCTAITYSSRASAASPETRGRRCKISAACTCSMGKPPCSAIRPTASPPSPSFPPTSVSCASSTSPVASRGATSTTPQPVLVPRGQSLLELLRRRTSSS